MKKKQKILLGIIAGALAILMIVGSVIAVVFTNSDRTDKPDDGTAFDELFVRDLLENTQVDNIINDPVWRDNLADSTDEYIMVDTNKFDFAKVIGMQGGYSTLYFDKDTRKINMIQHSLVAYVENEEPRAAVEKVVSGVEADLTGLLGNPEQKFMLMNTSGEFDAYEGLSVDEMIDKLLAEETVMYTMYENNGLKYEINVMYSDKTVYLMAWVYLHEVPAHTHDAG